MDMCKLFGLSECSERIMEAMECFGACLKPLRVQAGVNLVGLRAAD